jgi:hypothetical protein
MQSGGGRQEPATPFDGSKVLCRLDSESDENSVTKRQLTRAQSNRSEFACSALTASSLSLRLVAPKTIAPGALLHTLLGSAS